MSEEDVKRFNDIKDQIRVEKSKINKDRTLRHSGSAVMERLSKLREAESELIRSPARLLTVQLKASTVDSLQKFSWYTVASTNTGNNRTYDDLISLLIKRYEISIECSNCNFKSKINADLQGGSTKWLKL